MIEMLPLKFFDSNLYFLFLCLKQVMGYLSKINKVTHTNSKSVKGALRQQQEVAGQVSALIRVTERVERLVGKRRRR